MFPRIDFVLNLPRRKVLIYFSQRRKKWEVIDFVLERIYPEVYPKSEKIGLR